ISLFGLKSLLEIDAQIFQTLHPILGSKPAKLVGNILKGAVSVGFRMDLYGDKKDETSTNFKLDKLDLSSLGIGVTSDIVLIFDDLERTEISIREILGYVNFMIEVTQVKVILIANEEALLENEDARKIYLKFKEKVIGKTFEVANDVEKIVISFLKGTSFKNSQNLKSLLIELHTISNCLNLRIIKQAIYDFQYVCKQIPSDRLEHKEFYTMFARIFLALSIEAKKGE
ncbi:P-loop NTPase fold protein, partial [Pseudomonas viridiflava]